MEETRRSPSDEVQKLLQHHSRVIETSPDNEEDVVSQVIGNFGKWQLTIMFLLALLNIPCIFHVYSPTFLANHKEFWCTRPDNFKEVDREEWIQYTQSHNRCNIYDLRGVQNITDIPEGTPMVPCKMWEFAAGARTIVEEFTLVCDRQYLSNMSEMAFFTVMAIGGLVCGLLSDKFGRKKTLRLSVLSQTILGILIAFAPCVHVYFILRALLGFISVSVFLSGFVLLIEVTTGRWRTIFGLAYFFSISLGYALMSGIAWLLPDWRHLQLAISLPGFLFLCLCFFLPESPRWLLALGRTKEAKKILEDAAEDNRMKLPENLKELMLRDNRNEVEPNISIWDLFRTWEMTKTTLLSSVIWLSVYSIYYGLILNMQSIGWGIHVNTVVDGLMGIPAIALSIPILLKTRRRYPLSFTILLSVFFAVCIIPLKITVPNLQWPAITLTIMAKFFISSSLAITHVFTAELYPTTMRNLGMGSSNISAGIAFILIPHIYKMVALHISVPLIILGTFGMAGGICALFLREIGNKHSI